MYGFCFENCFGYVILMCVDFFRFGCMNILGLALKFGRRLMVSIIDFSVGCPKYRLSTPSKHSLEVWCMLIDNLTIADVSFFFFFGYFVFKGFFGLVVVWPSFHSGFLVIFRCLGILGLDVRIMSSVSGL